MTTPDGPPPLTKCDLDRLITEVGPAGPAYEAYVRWRRWWVETHPEDDSRSELDLIDEYARWYTPLGGYPTC